MKKVLAAICAVTLAGTVVAAQSGAAGAPGQEKKAEPGAMTVSGCVAAGAGPDQFQLTNATMATPAAEKAGDKPKGVTYNLVGGQNLKAHVGHRVEVTGMLAKPDPAAAKPAAGGDVRGTLNVKDVKMVSTTCP